MKLRLSGAGRAAAGWAAACSLLFCTAGLAQSEPQGNASSAPVVLTSVAPLYSLTTLLLQDTGVVVQNVPPRPRGLSTQASYFKARGANFAEDLQSATAVVGMAQLWEGDPLYPFARAANVRVVPVDATAYWGGAKEGVSVIRTADGAVSPHFWLSVTNVTRSADIVAADLLRLFPEQAGVIEENRLKLKRTLLALKAEYDAKFARVENAAVLALADEFVYLTADFSLFVDGYEVKQDADWLEEDLHQLEERLQQEKLPVVLHKWTPEERILDAIRKGGATLAVLSSGETPRPVEDVLPSDGLLQLLRRNLEALHEAFCAKDENC
ncbi:MAG: zinc ABC transporter substrate-binding protein [Acidobacteriota bacterium]